MKSLTLRFICVFVILLAAAGWAGAKEKTPVQTAWALAAKGPVEVHSRASAGSKAVARLGSGELVPVVETKGSGEWTKVHAMDPATLHVVTGWARASSLQSLPVDSYPPDADLEKILGGEYLLDVNARYTQMARFLVRLGGSRMALVCYIGSTFIPGTRLQVFELTDGKWAAGPHLEFLSSQMKTGVTEIEVRDLVGDGNECLITHEPFAQTFGTSGVNLVIRRIEAGKFKTLWQAPLELSNLTAFPPKINVLQPPEENIGAAGTVTQGSVDYKTSGRVSEPVWKGTVAFHIPGREEPLNTISIEKACPWHGNEFAPLK